MPNLLLKYDGVTINSYQLEQDTITIGRLTGNDIQLDDPAVSSRHACITRRPNRYLDNYYDFYIEDLGSTNGTRINNSRITRQLLKEGDEVRIGTYEFVFDSGYDKGMDTTAIFLPDEE